MDFRNVLITILATSITAFIVVVFVFEKNDTPQGYRAFLGPAESIKRVGAGIVAQVPGFFNSKNSGLDELVETMNNFLEEARALRNDEDRYILIEKVSLYDNALDLALKTIWDGEGGSEESLLLMSRTTARHLALWNPFFYYVHPEAQAKIFPLTRKLEEEHNKLLWSLADVDGNYVGEPSSDSSASLAGRVATEDLELYIEDIRKSAARRNSDFIRFSYEDYLRYREFFDELLGGYPDFGFGFADSAHTLFDDFYAMHKEVGPEYSDKTREYIQDMRVELRDLHKRTLLQLNEADEDRASEAVEKTLSVIADELGTHFPPAGGWRGDVRAIMEDDYNFYNEIKNELDN